MKTNLYLVGRSPANDTFTRLLLDAIVLRARNGEKNVHVHLLQDGVLVAKKGYTWESRVIQLLDNGVLVTVQMEDVQARGNFETTNGVKKVPYGDVIDAIFDSERVCSDI
ncbi:MAG: DsrH/TusB family sulfur metabolism protein [Candidatus Sigynarchaeota archaeon]